VLVEVTKRSAALYLTLFDSLRGCLGGQLAEEFVGFLHHVLNPVVINRLLLRFSFKSGVSLVMILNNRTNP